MSKFYQMEVKTNSDDSIEVTATATYEDSFDAQIAFSTKKAENLTAIKNGTIKACLIHTFGETGVEIPGMNDYVVGNEEVTPNTSLYQVEVQTDNSGATSVVPAVEFTDKIDAEISFSTKKAYNLTAIKNGTIKACLIHTFGATGTVEADMNEYLNDVRPVESDVIPE